MYFPGAPVYTEYQTGFYFIIVLSENLIERKLDRARSIRLDSLQSTMTFRE